MKIIHDRQVDAELEDKYTVCYTLAVIRNDVADTEPNLGTLYVPTLQFGVKTKDEIRKQLHEDIDRFVDLME